MGMSAYKKPNIKTNFSNIPTIIFVLITLFLYFFGLFSFYEYFSSPQGQDFIKLIEDNLPTIISIGTAVLPFVLAFLFFYVVISLFFSFILLWIMSKIAEEVTIVVTLALPLILIGLGILVLGVGGGIIGIILAGIGGLFLLLVLYKFRALKRAGKFVEFSAKLALDEKAVLVFPIIMGLFTLITGLFMMASYWEINQLIVNYLQTQYPQQASNIGTIVSLLFEYLYLIIFLGLSYIFNALVISYAGDWYRGLDPDINSARKDVRDVLPIILKFAFAMATVQMLFRALGRMMSGGGSSTGTGRSGGRRGTGLDLNFLSVLGIIGFFVVALFGAIWQFINYFTLISIVQNKQNLTTSIKDSASKRWHGFLDILVGDTGFGLTMFIFMVLNALIWFAAGFGIGYVALGNDLVIGLVVGVLFIVLSLFPYQIVTNPLNTSFKTFLYCYADDSTSGFSKPSRLPAELRNDFKNIQSRAGKRRMRDPSKIL